MMRIACQSWSPWTAVALTSKGRSEVQNCDKKHVLVVVPQMFRHVPHIMRRTGDADTASSLEDGNGKRSVESSMWFLSAELRVKFKALTEINSSSVAISDVNGVLHSSVAAST